MVRRTSIVWRIYLGVFVALLVVFSASAIATRLVFRQGYGEATHRLGQDLVRFAGEEVEHVMTPRGPSAERLETLSRVLHMRIAYSPWHSPHPAALAESKLVAGERTTPPPRWWEDAPPPPPTYWYRVDVGGKPVATLHMTLMRPRMGPRGREHAPFAFAAVLALALLVGLVPPLAWGVIRPLRRAVGIAHRLGEGELARPIPVAQHDEFGDLEAAFERLRQRIVAMLADKERLLSDISHELRAPLSRLAIALPLLRQSAPASPYLAAMERDLAHMDALIGELLNLARARHADAESKEPLDLAAIAREVLTDQHLSLETAGLMVETRLEPAPVRGNVRLLHRALDNLVRNAIAHAPKVTAIAIATGCEGKDAFFRVRNQGPGIDAAEIPKLFEPFYRPDESRTRTTGGVGLGLAIVKAIAEGHGGCVTLQSAPEGPTEATLQLALQTEAGRGAVPV